MYVRCSSVRLYLWACVCFQRREEREERSSSISHCHYVVCWECASERANLGGIFFTYVYVHKHKQHYCRAKRYIHKRIQHEQVCKRINVVCATEAKYIRSRIYSHQPRIHIRMSAAERLNGVDDVYIR